MFIPQLIGFAAGLGFEGYNQYQAGTFDLGRLAMAGATGIIGGFGSTAIRAFGFGAIAGAANNTYQQLDSYAKGCRGDFNFSQVLRSAGLGGAGGLFGLGAGVIGKNTLRPTNMIGRDINERISSNYGAQGSAIGAAGGATIANQ